MQLEHSFTVPVGIDQAWAILTDIGTIARFMPGSTVNDAGLDSAEGALKVKLGPLNLTYKGAARLVDTDVAAHRAVVAAQGADARNGTADATVTAVLTDGGDVTTVALLTQLAVTGKPAQFARTVMVDVGTKIVAQFAGGLSAAIDAGTLTVAEPELEAEPEPEPQPEPEPEPEPETEPAQAAAPAPAPQQPTPAPEPPAPAPEPPAPGATADIAAGTSPEAPSTAPSAHGYGTSTPAPATGSLLDTARPVIVKGLAPVAIAAVLVLGAARRRRGRQA